MMNERRVDWANWGLWDGGSVFSWRWRRSDILFVDMTGLRAGSGV